MSQSLHASPSTHSSAHAVAEHAPSKQPPLHVSVTHSGPLGETTQCARTFHASQRAGVSLQSASAGGGGSPGGVADGVAPGGAFELGAGEVPSTSVPFPVEEHAVASARIAA